MAIRAITFDFWQTLFRDVDADKRFLVREEAVVRLSGATHESVRAALEAMHKEFFRTHVEEQRNLTPADGVRLVCETLRWEPGMADAGELADVFADAVLLVPPEPVADAVHAVAAAAARVPVGLISDVGLSPGRCLRVLLDQHGFTPHFTALTFSHDVGVSKPQAAMFDVTAAALGVAPSELLHIGDLEPTDIAGVRALGGVGGLFTGVHDKYRATTTAEYIFSDWSDFLAQLGGILPRTA